MVDEFFILKEVITRLNYAGIPYMISGSMALNYYTEPRMTREELIKIDFIIRKNTLYRRLEFERRKKIKIEDMDTYIVSIEDLILSKLFWAKDSHSEIQLKDAKNLINEGNVDMIYIEKWALDLGIKDLLAEILP